MFPWYVQVAGSDHIEATIGEIKTQWSLRELVSAIYYVRGVDKLEEEQRKKQKRQQRRSKVKTKGRGMR